MSKYVVKKNGVVYEGGTLQTTNNFVSVTADGVKTYGQLLKELGLLIDSSRVTRDAVLVQKFTYTETSEARALFVSGFNTEGVTLCRIHYNMLRAVIHYDGSSSTFDSTDLMNDTGTDFTNTVAANTVSFFFYYSSALALDNAQGSGGHTIVNASNTDMEQRAKMQFVDVGVTDDSANNKTKVEVVQLIDDESELTNAPDGVYQGDYEDVPEDVLDASMIAYGNETVEDALDDVQVAIDSLAPKNLIKKRTFSGTTNSNGEISTAMPSTAIVVETQIDNGYFRLRTARSGNNLYAIVGYANGTVLANTAVSGTVYYIEP